MADWYNGKENMDITEAKNRIADEFITKYYDWLADRNNVKLTDAEYGRKYGWGKTEEPMKDNLKTLNWFQSHIYSGRYLPGWEKVGFNKYTIWSLHSEGFKCTLVQAQRKEMNDDNKRKNDKWSAVLYRLRGHSQYADIRKVGNRNCGNADDSKGSFGSGCIDAELNSQGT